MINREHEMTATTLPLHRVAASPLRLTRRGRVVVLLTLLTLLFVAFTLGRAGQAQGADEAPTPPSYGQTTVHSGETLWSVARRVAPGQDPRQVVSQIRKINKIEGSVVQVGQQLLVPKVA
jgi:hypothetical protein